MPFVPNELVLDVQVIEAGSVLVVENITPEAPAATSVVPSVASVTKLLDVGAVLDVHVVPSVDVHTLPVDPTATQAFIGGNHLAILAPVIPTVFKESDTLENEKILFSPAAQNKNLPFSYVKFAFLFVTLFITPLKSVHALVGNGWASLILYNPASQTK